ncbi:uncharacterized protein N7482_009155 [Penicillium canariense]|uniref:Integral membrane protein n=1 Tax=Penicillium canariense TaxID=189055 RepID=A0A9W9LFS8_9EURO|nr:uncharacterized protein N7482_009155 [Penicillium canariense]KAJ5152677.1 hypothetical protein N7482_009155 [Penicillium canariense]
MHSSADTKPGPDSDLELVALEPALPAEKPLRNASDITGEESLQFNRDTVTLVFRGGRFRLLHQQQFRNSLLASVGYLELANAADFAANVWNQIPVPTFAAVLMGIGGTCALGMVFVAVQDIRLSWRNVKLLRAERENLKRLRQYHVRNVELDQLLESKLGVSDREIGTEVVDRIAMDCLLGFGSVLVGVGTLMAIGGANPRVFKASNLLSGYIGNGLAALFGLVNAIWSAYLLCRFHLHLRAARAALPSDHIRWRLHTRIRRFQWHAFVNGLNGLVAGAGSLVTAERWWGYVVLIPCIISLIAINYFWRKKLGYDRPLLMGASIARTQLMPVVEQLEYVIAMQRAFAEPDTALPKLVKTDSLESMLRFIVHNHMLEPYCESLVHDKQARSLLQDLRGTASTPHEITISLDALLRLSTSRTKNTSLLLTHAICFLRKDGVRIFIHRERYLLELLGYAAWRDHTAAAAGGAPGATIETK